MIRVAVRPETSGWLTALAEQVLCRHVSVTPPGPLAHPLANASGDGTAARGWSPGERRRFEEALRVLPSKERVVLRMHDLDGFSYSEIALGLGIPSGTVRSRADRGRRLLAQIGTQAAPPGNQGDDDPMAPISPTAPQTRNKAA